MNEYSKYYEYKWSIVSNYFLCRENAFLCMEMVGIIV